MAKVGVCLAQEAAAFKAFPSDTLIFEPVVKPREGGAYVHQPLNLISFGKDQGRKAKASNRTTGNPAVRHYRGASGNVAMVEM